MGNSVLRTEDDLSADGHHRRAHGHQLLFVVAFRKPDESSVGAAIIHTDSASSAMNA